VVKPPPPPSRSDALAELLGSSRRDFVPVRKAFTQLRTDAGDPLPGPLASIVSRGVPTALDQYLLLHSRAAGRPDGDELNYDVGLSARVWARLLGLAEDESGRRTVGRNWAALSELKLVKTRRVGRQITVTLLREDGSGEPYTRPKTKTDPYLKIPYAFWLDGHAAKLKLPGLALAVIACSLTDWFPLPFDKGPTWYGIGSSTVERGLRELRRTDLIEQHHTWRPTALSDTGWTKDMRYRLRPPLGPLGHVAKGTPQELLAASGSANPSLQADSEQETPPPPQSSGDAA
jgi:DNA-binding transcriptional ArsR family regulator